jgi:hypothetical protein
MPNPQNLKPLTTKKAREIGRLGGIKSGEAKQAKKTLKQNIEAALEFMKKHKLSQLKDENMKKFLSETDILTFTKCEIMKDTQDEHIKIKAIESLEDRLHGKPKQDIEQTITTFDVAEDDIMKKIKEKIK